MVSQLRSRPKIVRKLFLVAESVEFQLWVKDKFESCKFYWTRESLWDQLLIKLSNTDRWTGYEFGVAWGYASEYWLTHCEANLEVWHGFDRFTGLPRGWRGLEAQAFDAGGKPPRINDPRVVWHVGDVESQLPLLTISKTPKLILFDLDLYEPTAFAWNYLSESLEPGDLIYFDEAFDEDERRVINELVVEDFKVSVIGVTHSAIALELGERI